MATRTATTPPADVPNGDALRVKAVIESIGAMVNHGDLEGARQDWLRALADDLGVPFLVVKLAHSNAQNDPQALDLADILSGLEWLREHRIPAALLGRDEPCHIEWQSLAREKA